MARLHPRSSMSDYDLIITKEQMQFLEALCELELISATDTLEGPEKLELMVKILFAIIQLERPGRTEDRYLHLDDQHTPGGSPTSSTSHQELLQSSPRFKYLVVICEANDDQDSNGGSQPPESQPTKPKRRCPESFSGRVDSCLKHSLDVYERDLKEGQKVELRKGRWRH